MVEKPDKAETGAAAAGAAGDTAVDRRIALAKQVTSAVAITFFIPLVIATILAGLGVLADGLAGPILTFVWWLYGTFAVAHSIGTLMRVATRPDDRKPGSDDDLGFPRAARVYRYMFRAAPIALVVGGHYELAVLLVYLICLGIARRVEDRRILGELEKTNPLSRGIHALVFATAQVLIPVVRPVGRLLIWRGIGDTPLIAVVLSLPFYLVYGLFLIPWLVVKTAFDWFRTRRGDRAMVSQLREAGTLAYFVYSEPHQREYFLGENGVLTPLADRVLTRDWRTGLETVRALADDGKAEGADAMFLRRFRLSSMKNDLPFVAVLGGGGKVRPFYCSGPYRQRRRDGGVGLIRVEDDIRSVLEKHVAALPAAG